MAEQFVPVRVQSMNGVNLDLFQFEYDLTWMAFFMDANDRFYARYGGRDDSDAESHLNKASLMRVMRQVLQLHKTKQVQTSRYEPTSKSVRTPEQLPPIEQMLAKRKSKCIHCHDVKVASLKHLQTQKRFRRDMVFTYPTPQNVGIDVDPREQNRVTSVHPASPASRAGIRKDDRILAANGQRILTFADFSRVLELTPRESTLELVVRRGKRRMKTRVRLRGNWRRTADPSWRESLHVAGPNCGLWGRKLAPDRRRKLGLADNSLALEVTYIWGQHTRRAGLRKGDVIVAVDGIRRDLTIQQFHAYPMLNKDHGDRIPIVVRRGKDKHKFVIRFPDEPAQD